MKSTVIHPTLGEITYEENFWTGKKQLAINGVLLQKQNKKTFAYATAEGTLLFQIKGSAVSGAKLIFGNEVLQLTPPPTWYEILCTVLFIIPILWGNIVSLCEIFPIIGGAIGGAVYGVMALVTLTVMKEMPKVWQKLLVFALLFLASFVLGFALALIFAAILL